MRRLVLSNCRLPDGAAADVLIEGGMLCNIAPSRALAGDTRYDVGGRLLTPGLTDPHLHPDKAYGLAEEADSASDVSQAIQRVRERKPYETADAVRERSLRLLRSCLRLGTTRVRLHAEVDPLLGLRSVEGVLAARRELAGLMRIEVVAFPQEGIVKEPGTLELMREALAMGCDVVGAISYQDLDAREHLMLAGSLAREFGLPLDVHADFCLPPERSQLKTIIEVTRSLEMEGRVTLGHCTTLARIGPEQQQSIARELARSGIKLIVLPRTDLYLDGAIAPLAALKQAGVFCSIASNNIGNAFTPAGRPSLPSVAALYALANREASRPKLDALARSLWQSSEICGVESEIETGAAADLALWPVEEPWQLVAEEPEPDMVLVGGEVVYRRGEEWIEESEPAAVWSGAAKES
jgi:cytosine deaminase